jgi:hypothetical protein
MTFVSRLTFRPLDQVPSKKLTLRTGDPHRGDIAATLQVISPDYPRSPGKSEGASAIWNSGGKSITMAIRVRPPPVCRASAKNRQPRPSDWPKTRKFLGLSLRRSFGRGQRSVWVRRAGFSAASPMIQISGARTIDRTLGDVGVLLCPMSAVTSTLRQSACA